jgi:hypothetical protein
MSRSKDPTRYPTLVYKAIEILDKYPERVLEFPCESLKEAQSFQMMLNSFKRAALDHGWDNARCPSLASMVARVITDKDKGTFMVTLSSIDKDANFQRWGKVVGLEE